MTSFEELTQVRARELSVAIIFCGWDIMGWHTPYLNLNPPQKKAEGELVTERVGGESASDMNTNATSLFGYLNRVGDASGGWGVNPWQAEPSSTDGRPQPFQPHCVMSYPYASTPCWFTNTARAPE